MCARATVRFGTREDQGAESLFGRFQHEIVLAGYLGVPVLNLGLLVVPRSPSRMHCLLG